MTASSADTAELPAVRDYADGADIAPSFGPPAHLVTTVVVDEPPGVPAPAGPARPPRPAPNGSVAISLHAGRPAVQIERRQARRQRRLLAGMGILVLTATLLLTIVVLGVVR